MPGSPDHQDAPDVGAALSTAVAAVVERHTGRRPTEVESYLVGEFLGVLMRDVLTDTERELAEQRDGDDAVRQLRWEVQETMRDDLAEVVEQETGRAVIAFMSANHIDPDMALEAFVLAPERSGGA